jgi:putative transcriptional regulator
MRTSKTRTKTAAPKYKAKSEAMKAVHETASGLYESGLIDKVSMRTFDAMCLTKIQPLGSAEIRALREKERVSQAVLASYLNVTTSLVSQWERGEKNPSGPSLKLLNLVEKHGLEFIR